MHSTTPDRLAPSDIADRLADAPALGTDQWDAVLAVLPADLETTARATGALTRVRGFASAAVLLRLILVYAMSPGWSLRLLGAWGVLLDLGDLSHVALLRAFRRARPWLEHLLGTMLVLHRPAVPTGLRLRIIDATVITKPGSTGTDWRLHCEVDLATGAICNVQLTDATGGERLDRFGPVSDAIFIADRGYAFASSLMPHLRDGQPFIVRNNWHNLRLQDADGRPFSIIAWLEEDADTPVREITVWLAYKQERQPLRLVRAALPTQAAAQARGKVRKTNKRAKPETVYAAGFVMVLTNLPAETWGGEVVLQLYRLRWQIELRIKRLKSLQDLDDLRAKGAEVAQSILLAKLLAAVLLDRMVGTLAREAAAEWWEAVARPVSLWRVEQWQWAALRAQVVGQLPSVSAALVPRLRRYFCDAPRARPQQLATARAMLARLGAGVA